MKKIFVVLLLVLPSFAVFAAVRIDNNVPSARGFPYRMPFSERTPVGVYEVYNKDGSRSGYVCFEPATKFDTVFAVRYGMVLTTDLYLWSQKNPAKPPIFTTVVVLHHDGTTATYRGIAPGKVLVAPNDIVTPATPLGIMGSSSHNCRLSFTYHDSEISNNTRMAYKDSHVHSDHLQFIPRFMTATGLVQPAREKKTYTPYVDDRVLAAETPKSQRAKYDAMRKTPQEYSADGKVVTVQRATRGKGLDIVVMGDAFTGKDMGGFYDKVMHDAIEGLFAVPPMSGMREYFNVHIVRVVSLARRSSFGINPTKLMLGCDKLAVLGYAQKAPLADKRNCFILVVVNEVRITDRNLRMPSGIAFTMDDMRSSGLSVVNLSRTGPERYDSKRFRRTVVHEVAGHNIGLLTDEYEVYAVAISEARKKSMMNSWTTVGYGPNVEYADTVDAQTVKWSRFIDHPSYPEVWFYEGGAEYYYGVWRPTEVSIMGGRRSDPYAVLTDDAREEANKFNAPSREAIYKRIKKLAGEQYSWEEFLEFDAECR